MHLMRDTESAENLRALAAQQLADPDLADDLPRTFGGLRVAVASYLADLTARAALPALGD